MALITHHRSLLFLSLSRLFNLDSSIIGSMFPRCLPGPLSEFCILLTSQIPKSLLAVVPSDLGSIYDREHKQSSVSNFIRCYALSVPVLTAGIIYLGININLSWSSHDACACVSVSNTPGIATQKDPNATTCT